MSPLWIFNIAVEIWWLAGLKPPRKFVSYPDVHCSKKFHENSTTSFY